MWNFTKNSVEALNLDPYVDPARERGVYEGDNYIHQLAQAAVSGDSAEGGYSLLAGLTAMAGNDPSASIAEYELLAPVAALTSYWQTGHAAAINSMYAKLQMMLKDSGPVNPSTGLVRFSQVTQLIRNGIRFQGPDASVGQPSLDIPLAGAASPASVRVPGIP